MEKNYFTDLASESRDLWKKSNQEELPGVISRREERFGFSCDRVEIRSNEAAEALCKPRGTYVTLELDALFRREENAFERCCRVLAEEVQQQLSLDIDAPVLVVALGNEVITPDAVGPRAAEYVMVTRHLKDRLPREFEGFRSVSVFCPGVLGTTGVESAALVHSVTKLIHPAAVIAVDALCARETARLCRAVQISDSGIVPGSGVGNARQALSRDTLGIPVISVGAPTVVDACALCRELTGEEPASIRPGELFVTPRDIDTRVRDVARLIGYSVDLALHPGLSVTDVDMFLS